MVIITIIPWQLSRILYIFRSREQLLTIITTIIKILIYFCIKGGDFWQLSPQFYDSYLDCYLVYYQGGHKFWHSSRQLSRLLFTFLSGERDFWQLSRQLSRLLFTFISRGAIFDNYLDYYLLLYQGARFLTIITTIPW